MGEKLLNVARDYAGRRLSPDRFQHSLGTEKCAVDLAARFGADPEKAALAGILHDIAREIPDAELVRLAAKHCIILRQEDKKNPILLHGRLAAALVRQELGITDPCVLDAIAYHISGRRGWTKIEQVLYLADKIEPTRDYPGVESLRKLVAAGDFDRALYMSLRNGLEYAREQSRALDPDMVVVFNEVSQVLEKAKRTRNR